MWCHNFYYVCAFHGTSTRFQFPSKLQQHGRSWCGGKHWEQGKCSKLVCRHICHRGCCLLMPQFYHSPSCHHTESGEIARQRSFSATSVISWNCHCWSCFDVIVKEVLYDILRSKLSTLKIYQFVGFFLNIPIC